MKYISLVFFLCCALISCDDDDTEDLASKQQRLADLQATIETLVTDKSCNGAGDCASVAFGDKPCGGPRSYLIYAPSNIDENQLLQLVMQYNLLDEEINILTNAVSDCAMVQEPTLSCNNNVCEGI